MSSGDYRQSHLDKGAVYDQDLADGSFDTFMTEREAALLPRIVARLFPATPPKYLDFACGTGRITSIVAPLARDSRGVDVSASMMAEAVKKCPQTTFEVRDITAQPLEDTSFDLATAFRFFGNAQQDLRRAALAAVSRHLVPGGYFVLNNHRNAGSGRAILQRAAGRYEDSADLDPTILKGLLHEAGFEIAWQTGIGWWMLADRLSQPSLFSSALVGLVEPLSTLDVVAPYCPAYIVVARKAGGPR